MGSALFKVVMDLPDDDREEAARSPYRDDPDDSRGVPAPADAGRKPVRILAKLLSALLKQPEMLAPPEQVIPMVATAGSVTMLAAREKLGKSTFAAFLAAVVSLGSSLWGHTVKQGRVLWVGLEEAPSHAVRRFAELGADANQIALIDHLPAKNPIRQLRREVAAFQPRIIIIDTLSALYSAVGNESAAAAWTGELKSLIRLARKSGAAILILHHATKKTGAYRGSTAIGASMDLILEMDEADDDDHVRLIKPRGRLRVAPYAVRFDGVREWTLEERTERDPAAARESKVSDLRKRILAWIAAQPHPVFLVAIRKAMGGRAEEVDAAVRALVNAGKVVRLGRRKGYTVAKRRR